MLKYESMSICCTHIFSMRMPIWMTCRSVATCLLLQNGRTSCHVTTNSAYL